VKTFAEAGSVGPKLISKTAESSEKVPGRKSRAMKFRLAAFWLFLLTVGGNHLQLSHVRSWGVAAEKQLHKGNELENALKLRETSKQTRVIGDITTTIQPDPGRSIGHQAVRRAKAPPPTLELHFRQSLARLFASEDGTTPTPTPGAPIQSQTQTNGTDSPSAAFLATDKSRDEATTTHHPGRRHVVPDKLQYTQEIQVKQGRLMGITRRFQVTSGLRQVDQFLGLPYAEAPTDGRRFMPPGECILNCQFWSQFIQDGIEGVFL